MEEKDIKQQCQDFDEYIKKQQKLGEVGSDEVEEMKEIFHELKKKGWIGVNSRPTHGLMSILIRKEQKWDGPYSINPNRAERLSYSRHTSSWGRSCIRN